MCGVVFEDVRLKVSNQRTLPGTPIEIQSEMLIKAFEQTDLKEIMLLKGARLIKVPISFASMNHFDKAFNKMWNKQK